MLAEGPFRFVNRLLASESWATDRLRRHSGRRLGIEWSNWRFVAEIGADGLLHPVGAVLGDEDVRIVLPTDTLLRLLTDRASVFAQARISGPADLSESLAFVFRNLRWDVEADLAGAIGDIPARRLAAGARQAFDWQRDAAARLAANAAEFFAEEQGLLTPRPALAAFVDGLQSLDTELARLEARTERLVRGR